jgi:hypothetical protein
LIGSAEARIFTVQSECALASRARRIDAGQ